MICAGFLSPVDRADLIRGMDRRRIEARRANALVLLDSGWSCEKVAGALLLDDIRSAGGTPCSTRMASMG